VALYVTHELSTSAKGQLVLQQPRRQGGAMHGAPGAVVPPVVLRLREPVSSEGKIRPVRQEHYYTLV
jgi:hypothetical protein